MDYDDCFPSNKFSDPLIPDDYHPSMTVFYMDYLLPLSKEKSGELDNNILFCPTDRFHRYHYNNAPSLAWAFNNGLIGFYPMFGNDDYSLADAVASDTCPNGQNWMLRKKVGGKYSKAPIMADNLQSIPVGYNDEEWIDAGISVPVSSHASRKNGIPEGGNFLFEDGSVSWYSGLETLDGQTSGDIGLGIIYDDGSGPPSWYMYVHPLDVF